MSQAELAQSQFLVHSWAQSPGHSPPNTCTSLSWRHTHLNIQIGTLTTGHPIVRLRNTQQSNAWVPHCWIQRYPTFRYPDTCRPHTQTPKHRDSPQLDTTQKHPCTWTPINLRTPRHLDTPTSAYRDARISLRWHTLILHILALGDPHLQTEPQPTQTAPQPNSRNLPLTYPDTLASGSPKGQSSWSPPYPKLRCCHTE